MNEFNQTEHRGFDIGRQLSLVVVGAGLLLLLGHLAGQMRVGSASGWSLLIGGGCLLLGFFSALLFSILARLDRTERQLRQAEREMNRRAPGDEHEADDSVVANERR